MFDAPARVGSRNSLDGYGGGLAGRGRDLNTAIEALVPLLRDLEPVLRNLSRPRTRLNRFFRSLGTPPRRPRRWPRSRPSCS